MAEQKREPGWPSPGAIASGLLDGHAEAIRQIGEPMVRRAPGVARYLLRRIPDGPGYVYDIATAAGEPDKLRGAFGVAGSVLGGLGGGALGGAAGGVNAPIGAAVGSAVGDEIGKQIYDEHREQIQRAADRLRRGAGDIRSWMTDRWRDVQGR